MMIQDQEQKGEESMAELENIKVASQENNENQSKNQECSLEIGHNNEQFNMELEFQFRRNIDFEVEQLMHQIHKIKQQINQSENKIKEESKIDNTPETYIEKTNLFEQNQHVQMMKISDSIYSYYKGLSHQTDTLEQRFLQIQQEYEHNIADQTELELIVQKQLNELTMYDNELKLKEQIIIQKNNEIQQLNQSNKVYEQLIVDFQSINQQDADQPKESQIENQFKELQKKYFELQEATLKIQQDLNQECKINQELNESFIKKEQQLQETKTTLKLQYLSLQKYGKRIESQKYEIQNLKNENEQLNKEQICLNQRLQDIIREVKFFKDELESREATHSINIQNQSSVSNVPSFLIQQIQGIVDEQDVRRQSMVRRSIYSNFNRYGQQSERASQYIYQENNQSQLIVVEEIISPQNSNEYQEVFVQENSKFEFQSNRSQLKDILNDWQNYQSRKSSKMITPLRNQNPDTNQLNIHKKNDTIDTTQQKWNKALETSIYKSSFISNEKFFNRINAKQFPFNQLDQISRISSNQMDLEQINNKALQLNIRSYNKPKDNVLLQNDNVQRSQKIVYSNIKDKNKNFQSYRNTQIQKPRTKNLSPLNQNSNFEKKISLRKETNIRQTTFPQIIEADDHKNEQSNNLMNSFDLNEDPCNISEQEVQNTQNYKNHKYNTTGGEKQTNQQIHVVDEITTNQDLETLFENQLFAFIEESQIEQNKRLSIISRFTTKDDINFITPNNKRQAQNEKEKSVNSDNKNQNQTQGEREFFHLIVLAFIVNLPPFMNEIVYQINPKELYARARSQNIKFNHFHEWIEHQIQKIKYNIDNKFLELELQWTEKKREKDIQRSQKKLQKKDLALKQLIFRMDFLKDQEEHLNSNRKKKDDLEQDDNPHQDAYMECVEFNQDNLDFQDQLKYGISELSLDFENQSDQNSILQRSSLIQNIEASQQSINDQKLNNNIGLQLISDQNSKILHSKNLSIDTNQIISMLEKKDFSDYQNGDDDELQFSQKDDLDKKKGTDTPTFFQKFFQNTIQKFSFSSQGSQFRE